MAEALIALGGNVGDVRETLERAIAALCDGTAVPPRRALVRLPHAALGRRPTSRRSSIARSSPRHRLRRWRCWPAPRRSSGNSGAIAPREQRWGPRTLDIDLIAYDGLALDTAELTLPHPRALERAFVLMPLAEIAPDRRIAGMRIADALARTDRTGIEKLPPRAHDRTGPE